MLAPLILTKGGAFYLLYKWFALSMTGYHVGFWQMIGLVILIDTANIALREPKLDKPARYAASILLGWLAKLMM